MLDALGDNCLVPIDPYKFLISTLLITGIVLSYLPQQLKIATTKTSQGLSPLYLFLGGLSSASNFYNVLILQWPYCRCCTRVTPRQCIYNILALLQVATQTAMFAVVVFLFYHYFPEDSKFLDGDPSKLSSEWQTSLVAKTALLSYCVLVSALALLVAIFWGIPSFQVEIIAAVLSFIAVVASLVQFLPQIFKTWELKAVGALSIPAMILQTPGSFLFCYMIAKSPGTNLSSWITFFVGGCLQGTLLIVCLYHTYGTKGDFMVVSSNEATEDEAASSRTNPQLDLELERNQLTDS